MPNLIEYAKIFQQKLQMLYLVGCTSAWMENNAKGVTYNGGKYVYMPELTVDGLGNYSRTNGFPRGSVITTNKQYELTQDRGRDFIIDAQDVDESGYVANIANIMASFQMEHVNPEIDCYRYSQIYKAALAASKVNSEAIAAAKVFQALQDDIATVEDQVGEIPLSITLSAKVAAMISSDIQKVTEPTQFKVGDVYTKVRTLDNNPLFRVPSARLKTEYTFKDGITSGQTDGGCVATSNAKDMNWIITPLNGPVAIAKVDQMRIFPPTGPNAYQEADAWKTDYRLYHDLWMLKAATQAAICNTGVIS